MIRHYYEDNVVKKGRKFVKTGNKKYFFKKTETDPGDVSGYVSTAMEPQNPKWSAWRYVGSTSRPDPDLNIGVCPMLPLFHTTAA